VERGVRGCQGVGGCGGGRGGWKGRWLEGEVVGRGLSKVKSLSGDTGGSADASEYPCKYLE
jgi:hypothetical protein